MAGAGVDVEDGLVVLRREYEEGLRLMESFLETKDTAIALLREKCTSDAKTRGRLETLKERGVFKAMKTKMLEADRALRDVEHLRHQLREAKHREIVQEQAYRTLRRESTAEIEALRRQLLEAGGDVATEGAPPPYSIGQAKRRHVSSSSGSLSHAATALPAPAGKAGSLEREVERQAVLITRLEADLRRASRTPPHFMQPSASPDIVLPPSDAPAQSAAAAAAAPAAQVMSPAASIPEEINVSDADAGGSGERAERAASVERELRFLYEQVSLYEQETQVLQQELDATRAEAAEAAKKSNKKSVAFATVSAASGGGGGGGGGASAPPAAPAAEASVEAAELRDALNASRAKAKRQEDRLLIKNAELIENDRRLKQLAAERDSAVQALAARAEADAEAAVVSSADGEGGGGGGGVVEEQLREVLREMEASLVEREAEAARLEEANQTLERRLHLHEEAGASSPAQSPTSLSSAAAVEALSDLNIYQRYSASDKKTLLRTIARQNALIAALKNDAASAAASLRRVPQQQQQQPRGRSLSQSLSGMGFALSPRGEEEGESDGVAALATLRVGIEDEAEAEAEEVSRRGGVGVGVGEESGSCSEEDVEEADARAAAEAAVVAAGLRGGGGNSSGVGGRRMPRRAVRASSREVQRQAETIRVLQSQVAALQQQQQQAPQHRAAQRLVPRAASSALSPPSPLFGTPASEVSSPACRGGGGVVVPHIAPSTAPRTNPSSAQQHANKYLCIAAGSPLHPAAAAAAATATASGASQQANGAAELAPPLLSSPEAAAPVAAAAGDSSALPGDAAAGGDHKRLRMRLVAAVTAVRCVALAASRTGVGSSDEEEKGGGGGEAATEPALLALSLRALVEASHDWAQRLSAAWETHADRCRAEAAQAAQWRASHQAVRDELSALEAVIVAHPSLKQQGAVPEGGGGTERVSEGPAAASR